MKELYSLMIERYKHNDVPTCAINFPRGEVCMFYRTSNFGTRETCVFDETEMGLERTDSGRGFLIPGPFCPIWRKNGSS